MAGRQSRQAGGFHSGLRIALSGDEGRTWREVFKDGTDNSDGDYTGFLTLLPGPEGASAVYLRPRKKAPGETGHIQTLAFVDIAEDGRIRSNLTIDPDACSCCTTAIATTSMGPIAAYRDHLEGDIRDISIVRLENSRWTAPEPVHRDGWKINGCPANGPVLSAVGASVAVAWFTAAGDLPRVKVAFSDDAGRRFGKPLVVADAQPVGWAGIVLLKNGDAVVSWLESTGGGLGEVRIRRVSADGRLGRPVVVAQTKGGRTAGIPQMVKSGESLVLAWRTDRVNTAIVPIPRESGTAN